MSADYVRWFEDLGSRDTSEVGGKNASLGEMVSRLKEAGIRVPNGFATTARAFREFLDANGLTGQVRKLLEEMRAGKRTLHSAGKAIRDLFPDTAFPGEIEAQIRSAYRELSAREAIDEVDVAVRSSATAEDLPTASFAGQQETFLNVSGEKALLAAVRRCFASLYTDRAIAYREEKGFEHMAVALSAGVQRMVHADRAGSGVIFTIDTESGFPRVVVVTAAFGLGENVVQGAVNPDEYRVFKPFLGRRDLSPIIGKHLGEKEKKMVYARGGTRTTKNVATTPEERAAFVLSDPEILDLARWAAQIEEHYGTPMDIEWAKDGDTGELAIVQARPETVQSQKGGEMLSTWVLKGRGELLLTGLAIGDAIAAGPALVIESAHDIDRFEEGSVLVTEMTDPDWVPIMKKAAAIVTNSGGRTCHAAIVARELGIPAVVGTSKATGTLRDGREVTVSCAEGEQGNIYSGILDFEVQEVDLGEIPATRTKIMINIASPDAAFRWWRLPVQGVGLARMEFLINNVIKVHPMALVRFEGLKDKQAKREIEALTRGYADKTAYFVDHLAMGIARIAAAQHPHPVIVRLSDFKTNEYAELIGGREFEPAEHNPMLGFRGASRYYSEAYREGFALECRALKRVRDEMGFTNVVVMVPFCRTLEEADKVLAVMSDFGLKRGVNGLAVYVMAEIPSNVVLAREFAQRFDGFSIGSNDLTQLVLGVDRDSGMLGGLFDERNEAVKRMISQLIREAHAAGSKVGICGQAPSDYPEFAEFLVAEGIDSISLNPDSVLRTVGRVAEAEKRKGK
jgi:pyruvate,water dikinase